MTPLVPDDPALERLTFFCNGWLVHEVVRRDATFSLRRINQARCCVRIAAASGTVELALWTAPKGRVCCRLYDGPPPGWLRGRVEGEDVCALDGDAVSVHFEHLDRNFYHLGLSHADEHWMLNLAGAGYLKLALAKHLTACGATTVG